MGEVLSQKDLPGIPDVRFGYQGQCWWCGNAADSREHKYKRSDIVREFGRGPWAEPMLRVAGGNRQFRVQGPNSQGLKFSKSLCQRCNNDRNQPFDLAYDSMMDYISRNESEIIARSCSPRHAEGC